MTIIADMHRVRSNESVVSPDPGLDIGDNFLYMFRGRQPDEEEKKASFAKAASLRAAELLILNGVNPETGYKFASDDEAVEAGAALVLRARATSEVIDGRPPQSDLLSV